MIPAILYVIPAKAGIYPSVIANPDLSGCGNPFSQYITDIFTHYLKNILKYFPKKEGFLKFMWYIK